MKTCACGSEGNFTIFILSEIKIGETYVIKAVILPDPLVSCFLSGLMPFMIQMDSKTSLTSAGGFCIDFNSVISEGFKVSRAAKAASKAGIASARSPSQSS